jgi:prepilin-type processing-associated H-X9-DG protein
MIKGNVDRKEWRSYSSNFVALPEIDADNTILGSNNNGKAGINVTYGMEHKLKKSPSQMVTICEFIMEAYRASYTQGYGSSQIWNLNYWAEGTGSNFGTSKPSQYILTRHKTGSNFLFWDGHVEFLNPIKISGFTGKYIYNQGN